MPQQISLPAGSLVLRVTVESSMTITISSNKREFYHYLLWNWVPHQRQERNESSGETNWYVRIFVDGGLQNCPGRFPHNWPDPICHNPDLTLCCIKPSQVCRYGFLDTLTCSWRVSRGFSQHSSTYLNHSSILWIRIPKTIVISSQLDKRVEGWIAN